MKKNWNILQKYSEDKDLVSLLLENRGIVDLSLQESFLKIPSVNNSIKKLDKSFLKSVKGAKDIIEKQISEDKPILIYGDYDADGICAVAILYKTLVEELDHKNTYYFIPNRFEHGYGLSKAAISEALSKVEAGGERIDELLVITVDTGITANEEVAYLRSLGIKTILTDHHQKGAEVPLPDVLVWNDAIVGSTIAFILSIVLGSSNPHNLALAGIATITDVQPVLGFNRSLVKQALDILNTDPPIGIKILLEHANSKSREISTYDLGWVIGPRLNASGRIAEATDSLQLLIETDPEKISKISEELNSTNLQRQDKTLEMYEIAAEQDLLGEKKVIITHSPNYHEGIIGLVASRLVKKHYKPSIVISLEDDIGKGSVRSVEGIDIISILREFEDYFVNLGGHPMAAGFTIMKDKIPELQDSLYSYFDKNISEDLLIPNLMIDLEIPLSQVSIDLLDIIEELKPFGLGNNEPVFVSKNVNIVGINKVGSSGQHISFRFYDNNSFYKGIFFNGYEHMEIDRIMEGSLVDVVYKLKRNEYNGRTYTDLFIEDIRLLG